MAVSVSHETLLAQTADLLDSLEGLPDDVKDECFAELCAALGVPNAPDETELEAATGQ